MALEDDRFLIDVYSVDQLLGFRLKARPQILRQATTTHAEEPEHLEGHDITTTNMTFYSAKKMLYYVIIVFI